jgi:hypothetical protein
MFQVCDAVVDSVASILMSEALLEHEPSGHSESLAVALLVDCVDEAPNSRVRTTCGRVQARKQELAADMLRSKCEHALF